MKTKGIDYLGLDRVLQRGSGRIIDEQDDAILVCDSISGAYMLACEETAAGALMLDKYVSLGCDLLMVSDYSLGKTAFEDYRFSEKMVCRQVAYYGEKPETETGLYIRTAEEKDFPILMEHYHLISPQELKKVIGRKNLLMGYDQDRLVGFIGEHLEGSMGMLYVFPEYRHNGFGAALQTYLIAKTMEKGYVPFGQVEKDNEISLYLQKKIGMTLSDKMIMWMWK